MLLKQGLATLNKKAEMATILGIDPGIVNTGLRSIPHTRRVEVSQRTDATNGMVSPARHPHTTTNTQPTSR